MPKGLIAFKYFGGKNRNKKYILPHINAIPHLIYCEPFSGSAAIMLNKKPSKITIYNDLDEGAYLFFRCLRDQKEELIEKLRWTPYSRQEFSKSNPLPTDTDLEKARKFFVNKTQSFSASTFKATKGQWSSGKDLHHSTIPRTFAEKVEGLYAIANRFKQYQIENTDAIKCIKKWDKEDTLFYIDSPYLYETRTRINCYKHEMTNEQHIELINLLHQIKGKFILSGYPSELYDSQGWHRLSLGKKFLSVSRMTDGKRQRLVEEILYSNVEFK